MTILEGYFSIIDDYPEDELKICVASSYPFFVKKDKMIHCPFLAPSLKLLRDYKSGYITWEEYVPKFKDEMRSQAKSQKSLEWLKCQDKEGEVIRLLCWEKAEDSRCHRFILLDILSSMKAEGLNQTHNARARSLECPNCKSENTYLRGRRCSHEYNCRDCGHWWCAHQQLMSPEDRELRRNFSRRARARAGEKVDG